MSQCSIPFIDSTSYFDIASEVVSIAILLYIISQVMFNYRQLKKEKAISNDNEMQKSIRRKINVNKISIIYLTFLFIQILFSILIFQLFHGKKKEIQQFKINIWYKWCEIISINLLNSLNLTVGFLYWKATRAYYQISLLDIPFFYTNVIKALFYFIYGYCLVVIIASLTLLLIVNEIKFQKSQILILNYLNAFGVSISNGLCLISRLLFCQYILNCIKMNRIAIIKEQIYTVLISISTLFRIICVILNLIGIDYSQSLRNYDQNCYDTTPYHAILLFFITIVICLIPPVIFSMIFTTNQKQRKNYQNLKEVLNENHQ